MLWITRKYAISKWIPPIDPFIRINFNPAFDPKEYRSGSGVVIRDDRGDVISQNQHCMGVVSPFAVEALVCSRSANRLAYTIAFESLRRSVEV